MRIQIWVRDYSKAKEDTVLLLALGFMNIRQDDILSATQVHTICLTNKEKNASVFEM